MFQLFYLVWLHKTIDYQVEIVTKYFKNFDMLDDTENIPNWVYISLIIASIIVHFILYIAVFTVRKGVLMRLTKYQLF